MHHGVHFISIFLRKWTDSGSWPAFHQACSTLKLSEQSSTSFHCSCNESWWKKAKKKGKKKVTTCFTNTNEPELRLQTRHLTCGLLSEVENDTVWQPRRQTSEVGEGRAETSHVHKAGREARGASSRRAQGCDQGKWIYRRKSEGPWDHHVMPPQDLHRCPREEPGTGLETTHHRQTSSFKKTRLDSEY